MNRNTHTIDEPKLTAYALGELGAQERAAIERRLADDPKARQQVEETIAFAVRLGSALRAEEAPELRAEQLRAIREAAQKQRKVIAFPIRLTRAAVPLAAAAGVALAGWFAIPAFRAGQQPADGQVAQAEGKPESREAWLERATELAAERLDQSAKVAAGDSLAAIPAPPPAPAMRLNERTDGATMDRVTRRQTLTPTPPVVAGQEITLTPTARPVESGQRGRQLAEVEAMLDSAGSYVGKGKEGMVLSGHADTSHTSALNADKTDSDFSRNRGELRAAEAKSAPVQRTDIAAGAAEVPAPAPPPADGGGVHRGAVTLGLAPQSAAGGALGLPAAVPAQARAGGAMVPSAPMARMGGFMVAAETAPAAGGGVAGVDSYGATAGGALAKGQQPVAREGGQLARRLMVEVMPHPAPPAPEPPMVVGKPMGPFDTETYDKIEDNPFLDVTQTPLSTFSIDVDTGSYANVRRFLRAGQLPPAGAVRIEEMLNYFEYDYPPAPEGKPFSVSVDVVEAPWNAKHQLARIGLKGREIDPANRPPCNLVFLLDVSGSMNQPNKLPLVKQAMKILLEQLGAKDRVAIVTYAGASGLALPSTPADRKRDIREAIDELRPGGSTNGAAGIQLAYDIAKANLIPGGANRVILATDGDFNIGVTSRDELLRLIEEKAKSNVFLTVLGFGMGNLKDATLEQLADRGNGTYGYIDDEREAKRLFARHATGSLVTIAKDVKIQVEFNPARVGAYRLIGYENRALRAEDFNDDKKDAGEIGSGHTVTALYELVPPGEAVDLPTVDALKYQQAAKPAPAAKSDEIMTVKLRYKKPDGDTSDKIEIPVRGDPGAIASAGADLKFASAVAEFGMLLRHSPHKGSADWKGVLERAAAGRGADGHGDRAEFIDLVRTAEKLSDQR